MRTVNVIVVVVCDSPIFFKHYYLKEFCGKETSNFKWFSLLKVIDDKAWFDDDQKNLQHCWEKSYKKKTLFSNLALLIVVFKTWELKTRDECIGSI